MSENGRSWLNASRFFAPSSRSWRLNLSFEKQQTNFELDQRTVYSGLLVRDLLVFLTSYWFLLPAYCLLLIASFPAR
jgi:hypothetical protein